MKSRVSLLQIFLSPAFSMKTSGIPSPYFALRATKGFAGACHTKLVAMQCVVWGLIDLLAAFLFRLLKTTSKLFIAPLIFINMQAQVQSNVRNNSVKKTTPNSNLPYMAVINKPVVDMNSSTPTTKNLFASPGANKSCGRSHQGLYNELVTCIEEKDNFVKIFFRNIKYNTNASTSFFWTEKKNITPLKKMKQKNILQSIPHPEYGHHDTIILTYPWKDFSVGTRFKHLPERDTRDGYAVIQADFVKNKIAHHIIPHANAMQEIQQSTESARQLFVTNIKNLIDRVTNSDFNSVIPYVWGGSSFVHNYTDELFHQKSDGAWHRQENNSMYMGYDCSEFVMRMAQIAGLDFPWKTTIAIQSSKRKLSRYEQLENGDLIWFKGHVMIISDINRNEVIEARGYPSGYGRIHKIKLYELFENIETYDDLLESYHNNKSLRLKNKEGEFFKKIDSFQLLKLID